MPKKRYVLVWVILRICLSLSCSFSWGETVETGDFTVTWKDLQELFSRDANEIRLTWAEFRILLRQTGNPVDIVLNENDGIVTLTRDQFQQLLSKMRPFSEKPSRPPKDYVITNAEYYGVAGNDNCRFRAVFTIFVFEQEAPGHVAIPLVHSAVALRNVRVDSEPAAILTNGDWHGISLVQPGYHNVIAIFSVAQNNQALSLPVTRAITNRIDFTVPDSDLDITVTPSLCPHTAIEPDGIRFTGYAPSTDQLQIRWTRQAEEHVKRSALFYAATRVLLSVDADIFQVNTEVELEVIQGGLNHVALRVPQNYEVINVQGEAVSEWRVRRTDSGQVLEIPFQYEVNNNVNFSIQAERILARQTLTSDFKGFQVIDARRETGEIGVVAESAVEVQVQERQDLQPVEYQKLPQAMLNMSARPMLFAFRYASHPYHLDINITKHERMEGITTIIESAEATVLFLQEGKILYHIVYTVRNTFKQFMELTLPENAVIWTVYVDNARAKASRNEQGNVLISLVRSSGDGIKPFRVELTYTLPADEFGLTGKGTCLLPATDIFTNSIRLAVYIPPGFDYTFEQGEWKEAAAARNAYPVSKTEAEEDKDIRVARTVLEDKSSFSAQGMTGPAGLSSIKVYLPLSGDQMAFTKTVIDKHETFPLLFSYRSHILKKAVRNLIMITAIVGIAFVIIKIRRAFAPR